VSAVESSVSTSDALVRPWRTATIVASLVAAVELFILIGFGVALFGQPLLDWAQGAAERGTAPAAKEQQPAAAEQQSRQPVKPAAPKLARSETSVLVLNGNGIAGAAASAGQLVRRKGYVVAEVGNAPRSDYRRSVVMYRPGYAPEAARFARDLSVNVVTPLDGLRLKDLMGAHVAVVLGAD
jgi:pyruvate/2-oxoglutarate dehydrogenase complex dihydrolipoamide acyltransferase (E2) component